MQITMHINVSKNQLSANKKCTSTSNYEHNDSHGLHNTQTIMTAAVYSNKCYYRLILVNILYTKHNRNFRISGIHQLNLSTRSTFASMMTTTTPVEYLGERGGGRWCDCPSGLTVNFWTMFTLFLFRD